MGAVAEINMMKNTQWKDEVQLLASEKWEVLEEAGKFFLLIKDALGWLGVKDREVRRIEIVNTVGENIESVQAWMKDNVYFYVPRR